MEKNVVGREEIKRKKGRKEKGASLRKEGGKGAAWSLGAGKGQGLSGSPTVDVGGRGLLRGSREGRMEREV